MKFSTHAVRLFGFACFFASAITHAETSTIEIHGETLKKNNEEITFGVFSGYEGLSDWVRDNNQALTHAEKSERYNRYKNYSFLGALGFLGLYITGSLTDTPALAASSYLGAFSMLGLSSYYRFYSLIAAKRAVNFYNGSDENLGIDLLEKLRPGFMFNLDAGLSVIAFKPHLGANGSYYFSDHLGTFLSYGFTKAKVDGDDYSLNEFQTGVAFRLPDNRSYQTMHLGAFLAQPSSEVIQSTYGSFVRVGSDLVANSNFGLGYFVKLVHGLRSLSKSDDDDDKIYFNTMIGLQLSAF